MVHAARRAGWLSLATLAFVLPGCGSESAPEPGLIVFEAQPHDPDWYGNDLFVVGPDGKGLKRLMQVGIGFQPAWSPDGSLVAFGYGAITIVAADGTGERRLTSTSLFAHSPAWSPDGGSIAYVSRANDPDEDETEGALESAIHVVNADGTGSRVLADGPGRDLVPGWSPDGRRIVFWRERDPPDVDGAGDVYVVDADGTDERRLPGADDFAWSPDWRRLVFSRPGSPYLFLLDTDGGAQHRLTSTRRHRSGPFWSPDGEWIAFERWTDDDYASFEIVFLKLEDGTQRVLAVPQFSSGMGSWSPDSRQFVARAGDELVIVDVLSGKRVTVAGPFSQPSDPDWAPAAG